MKKILAVFANTGLTVVAVGVLAAPLLLGQFLSSYQSGALGETTTQTATQTTAAALFSVATNASQFEPYVEFDPQPLSDFNTYQTSVTFTAFSEQQAAYNGLLSITNTSNSPIAIKVEAGKASGLIDNSRIWLTLASSNVIDSTLTTKAATIGQTELAVAQSTGFNSGSIVVGDQVLRATSRTSTALNLDQPLVKNLAVGQKVFFAPAYFNSQAAPQLSTTGSIVVQPKAQASLNLVVATEANKLDTNQIVIPLSITAE